MLTRRSYLRLAALVAGAALAGVLPARAQSDSVTVVAGAHYRAGALRNWLLGRDYRDLWTTPVRVPVLDLGSFAGGLTPVRRGGGRQTISLRFRAGDGREYNFRSVDKDQTGGLHPDFQNTLVDRVAQDQVSSKHPASALISDGLMDAAGVLHPSPQLYVMPDDPRLGEFRPQFAGLLGMLEVHTDEGEGNRQLFAGAERVVSSERLLEHLEESPEDRVDSRAYLKARLLDLLMGDWDRHVAQWRWARYDRGGVRRWVPVPEDRDNAFSDYDGLLMSLVRPGARLLVTFEERYPSVYGLTENAQPLDRRLLSELPREAFDSVAAELQRRLTDEVIRGAVARAPREYHALRGPELTRKLIARRDALGAVAQRFFRLLAREVDVHATDEAELAEVQRRPDGTVDVRLFDLRRGVPAREPYFQRRFVPAETREVRLYLHGGDDRVVVRGDVPETVRVRVIGGGGDDLLADSARVADRGTWTAFYDHRGKNRVEGTAKPVVDGREFQEPEGAVEGLNDNRPPFRDWGMETRIQPTVEWRYNAGPVVGARLLATRYGFRRAPYASQFGVQGVYAPLENRFGLEAGADLRRTNAPSRVGVRAHATQLEVTRFHGFGNSTLSDGAADLYKVWETELRAGALYHHGILPGAELFVGPVAQYTRPEPEAGSPAAAVGLRGSEPFGQLGMQAGAALDTRDLPTYPRRGVHAVLRGSAFPAAWGVPAGFGKLDAQAAAYLPLPFLRLGALAVRAGGQSAFGDFPFQEAAFVGGSETLRGFPRQRFAGDAALFAGAELRSYLMRINFISRADLGVIALADAGRVFADGEASDRWHSAGGGGVWVGILDRSRTFSVVAARGEETAVYVSFGMPF